VVEIMKGQIEKGAQMVYNQEGVATRFQLGVPFQIQTEYFCSWAFDVPLSETQKETYLQEELVDTLKIDMTEYLNQSVYDYGTINDWFSRKIDPTKRPISEQQDESIVVSPADARLIVFPEVRTEPTALNKFWIKGDLFTLPKLLNIDVDTEPAAAAEWDRGAMGIFRLAPQDYHRYHSPVAGVITSISDLVGSTYFSVSADAIR
jgi:phosphatidylserine decarboxylase|tara:strand:- start:58 stop:672 length:615 start_codon:yes stop_codon:yes gene_type:complete